MDVVVTERGVAVNPKRKDLIERLDKANISTVQIKELKELAESIAGKPQTIKFSDRIIGNIEYRNGQTIDHVFMPLI